MGQHEPSGFVHRIDATRGPGEVYVEVEKVLAAYSKQKVVWVTGQPLSGKTLIAGRLAMAFDGVALNYADLLKAEAMSTSQLGKQIGNYIKRQERVPPELIVRVVKAAMDRSDKGLLVLDGFPRKQSEADLLFGEVGEPKMVIHLDAAAAGEPDSVSIEKIKEFDTDGDGMLSKEEFEAAGYIGTMLERNKAVGGPPAPNMIAKLQDFRDETVPVIDTYEKYGIVKKINATDELDNVIEQ